MNFCDRMEGQLYIFHVSLPDDYVLGYDSYSEFVVISKNEQEARRVHPESGMIVWDAYQKNAIFKSWVKDYEIDKLLVKCIGIANNGFSENTIIVSSYHAG